jgi:hypothetical protein
MKNWDGPPSIWLVDCARSWNEEKGGALVEHQSSDYSTARSACHWLTEPGARSAVHCLTKEFFLARVMIEGELLAFDLH